MFPPPPAMRALALLALCFVVAACDSSGPTVAEANSTVAVSYEGRLEDGRVFDRSERAVFSLRNVIPGFREGMIGMTIGETRTFTVSPEDGYGANPPSGSIIPPNATLVFEVTLLDLA